MNIDPNSDFLSWAKISHQVVKTKSTCISYLEQFANLLNSYFNNSNKLPKPIEQHTKQFENEVIPNVISNVILVNDGNDIFVSNLTTFLKEINILFFKDILKGNYKHVEIFLQIFNSSNKLYAHGMTPFSKGSTFLDVSVNFLKENPFQRLVKTIYNNPNFSLFHIIYSLFDNLKDFVDPTDIENTFQQISNSFTFLLESTKAETLNTIKPKVINSCLKFVFKYTAKKMNFELMWNKCADFLQFELKNGDSEHQTMAAKSMYQMVNLSDLYRDQLLKRIKKMNLVRILINNDYSEKLIGYFTSIISQFLSICMPAKSDILQLYDIVTEKENLKLKPLFLYFIKNLSTENSVDLFSTIFDTRPTTKKHVEILSLCVSELIILNFMVGNKIINHFMVLIDNDETAEASILFFQKILPLPLPKEIISSIVDIANRKFSEPVIKDTSIYFMKVIITIPNRLTIKYTFILFNSIVKAIETHENQAEIFFDMIIMSLTIYQKSVLSTEQLKKLLPIINKNQWWEKLNGIFLKRSSLFFTSNGLIELENEIEKFDFEKVSPQFTLFLLSFISHLCVYKRIYNIQNGNYISVQNIPDLRYIIRIIIKTPDHQSFVYVMNYYILVWNHLEKVTPREATLHFLQCFMLYIDQSSPMKKEVSDEVKSRIFQLMCKQIEVLEKSISIEDYGIKRHKISDDSMVEITAVIQNGKTLKISIKENQTLDDLLKRTAFALGYSFNSIKFKEIYDPYQQIKQTKLRTFNFEIVKEKKMEIKIQDMPTQIFVENGIDEILLKYLEHVNSIDAWNLLEKLPTNKKLLNKLSNSDEIDQNFLISNSVSKLYFRYEIESLLEVINDNKDTHSSYQKYGILILKELINGRIEGKEIPTALKIIKLTNPELNDEEIKDVLIFLFSNNQTSFTLLFEALAKKYPKQVCDCFMSEKSIKDEYVYSAPAEYISIIFSLLANYDKNIVFQYLVELLTHLHLFQNSIEPILSLYDKFAYTDKEAHLLTSKITSTFANIDTKQYPGMCKSLIKYLDQFPLIENSISQLIPYIIDHLYESDDCVSLLNFLVRLKSKSAPAVSKILKVHCDFYDYSTEENQRNHFIGLKNEINHNLSYLSSILQQLFYLQPFKSSIISEKVDIKGYESLRKLFCILQFSNLPFYPMTEVYNDMNLGDMQNPSRFYDLLAHVLPSQFTSIFEGTILSLQQDLSSQAITSTQHKFNKLLLNAKEMYSIDDCLSHFFREEKIPSKQAVHHYTISEFPNVLVLLLKIFIFDDFEDLLSKIGNTIIIPDTLTFSNQSNVTNPPVYNLNGVIFHKGLIKSGRYVSQVNIKGKSYLFDDSNVSDFIRTEDMSPFLLFYVKQGTEEANQSIEIPEDMNDYINDINKKYNQNQILFSEDFRSFVLQYNDALLITRYLINIYCHSKFNPNLIKEFVDKDLVNVSSALHYFHKNVDIINNIRNKQMKKMILYLAKVLIKIASKEKENEAIDEFFSSCIEDVESTSLYDLMIYYLTQVNNEQEIIQKWGEKVASIIIKGEPNSSLLFQILSILKYSEYERFFTNEVISFIYSENISSNAFIKYLKSIDADVMSIIKLNPFEYYPNLLIFSIINDFMEINFQLLKTGEIEKKFYLQTFLNGLDNQTEGLRESIISHFPYFLSFLPIPEGKFAEAVIYYLFPNLTNPIDKDKKRMTFISMISSRNKGSEPKLNEEEETDEFEHLEEEEEEEEWEEEEEINQNKYEVKKVDKITNEEDKNLMNELFKKIVNFILNLENDQPIYYTLRVICWMVEVGGFVSDELINACLQIMNKQIDQTRLDKKEDKCLILKIMKSFPQTFFRDNFSKIIQFALPTSNPLIFAYFFYTTTEFLSDNSNQTALKSFIESPAFYDSFRHFLKKSNLYDLDIFIDSAKKIKNLKLSEIMDNGMLHRLTMQKVICYQSFTKEIDKKMTNHLLRYYFRKLTSFKDHIPLFGRFTHSISQIMKPEFSRSSMYLKNADSFFSLFENDESKFFRKELETVIITMSQSDSSVRSKFVDLIMNCHSKKSKQLQLDLYSLFFRICEDPKLINHNLEMLANFIDNCKQKEVILILDSINLMLSKRKKEQQSVHASTKDMKKKKRSNDDSDENHSCVANGIETEKIYDILIILIDFYDWIPEIATCFEFILTLMPEGIVISLVDTLLNVVEEKDDDYSENVDENDEINEQNEENRPKGNQFFCKKIPVGILTDVVKKGVSFIKARPELQTNIIDMFQEGGYLENWPPEIQEFSRYYFPK